MKAFWIILSMVSYTAAVKIWAYIKANKIDIEGWNKSDFDKLMEDPKFKKYNR